MKYSYGLYSSSTFCWKAEEQVWNMLLEKKISKICMLREDFIAALMSLPKIFTWYDFSSKWRKYSHLKICKKIKIVDISKILQFDVKSWP